MGIFLVQSTRYLLCIVSMLLTGLFALELSMPDHEAPPAELPFFRYLMVVLMVAVGICIDVSKYLFWQYRSKSIAFIAVSITLVGFSWFASVAFFVANQKSAVEDTRKGTTQYRLHVEKIEALQGEIVAYRALAEKRMDSRYHAQWDRADEALKQVEILNKELSELTAEEPTIGLEEIRNGRGGALFAEFSQQLDISVDLVSGIAYGILAMLIEICALGTITISGYSNRSEVNQEDQRISTGYFIEEPGVENEKVEEKPLDERRACLRQDIISGKIEPIVRKIEGKYGLSRSNIKSVLQVLEYEGFLVRGKKNLIRAPNR